jgi:cation transport protein ChaC
MNQSLLVRRTLATPQLTLLAKFGQLMNTHPDNEHFWVFGYGSLMWNPGFEFLDSKQATIDGFHRSPCIYSWVHRGTRERPGIVLGLDKGGVCNGMAFQVSVKREDETLDYLRKRELVTNVYLETTQIIELPSGEKVEAVTYIVDTQHEQYAGKLSFEKLINQIQGARGGSGPNEEYFIDTATQLEKMNIHDDLMQRIKAQLSAS